jgi:hypothetical protein
MQPGLIGILEVLAGCAVIHYIFMKIHIIYKI